MAPSSAVFRPYIWAYGMTTGRGQLTPDRYSSASTTKATPHVVLRRSLPHPFPRDPLALARRRMHRDGASDIRTAGSFDIGVYENFTIHFQPSRFDHLFGIPMTELTDRAYDAYAVIGPKIEVARG